VDSGVAHHHEVNACPTDASIMEEGEEEERGGGDGWGESDDDDDDGNDDVMMMTDDILPLTFCCHNCFSPVFYFPY